MTRRRVVLTLTLLLLLLPLAAVAGLYALALASRDGAAPGLVDGRLAPCDVPSHCVCSDCGGAAGHVAPLVTAGAAEDAAWAALVAAVADTGGRVVRSADGYLAAEYRSSLFGFVDDLEARRDDYEGVIQLRSASRVGRADLGANRARVEALREAFRDRIAVHEANPASRREAR